MGRVAFSLRAGSRSFARVSCRIRSPCSPRRMRPRSTDVRLVVGTKEQAKKLSRGLYPVQNYLYRLRRRMEQVGFPRSAPLYALVDAAYDAVHRLNIHVHYMGFATEPAVASMVRAVSGSSLPVQKGRRRA